jgi:hypothetical protein
MGSNMHETEFHFSYVVLYEYVLIFQKELFQLIICAVAISLPFGPSIAIPFVLKQNLGTFNLRIAAEHT